LQFTVNALLFSNKVMVFFLHLMSALTFMLLVYSSHHTIVIPFPSLGNCTFLIPCCCYCFLVVNAPFPDEPLKNYRVQLKSTSGKQPVNFNRFQMSAFRQLMRLMKDPNLDLRKEPDILFEGELGADLGGPKREFFSRAMQSLVDVDQAYKIQLFGGLEDHRIPLYNVDAISEGCFTMAGRLLAWSVLHDGESLVGLAPSVVEYLSTGSVPKAACKVTMDDVCDLELKDIIDKVGHVTLLYM